MQDQQSLRVRDAVIEFEKKLKEIGGSGFYAIFTISGELRINVAASTDSADMVESTIREIFKQSFWTEKKTKPFSETQAIQ